MKKMTRIWRYLGDYKSSLALYFICSLLYSAFSVISIGLLAPILNTLFGSEKMQAVKATGSFFEDSFNKIKFTILSNPDKLQTLTIICVTVVICIFLKNLFYYLAINILLPVRHSMIRRLRNEMFEKILSLPIGYFTDERKGDIISRMTHDVNELQTSVMSVMEVFIREPVTIVILLASMIYISPQLSLFLLILLPVSGLIIGKIGSSLRRSARTMSMQMSDILGVLDETLTGMRVVKAFNAEKPQYLKFLKLNNENYRLRNAMSRKQELASPLSETMGVTVVAGILAYGGNLVLKHELLSPASFITFIALFTQVINPVKNLGSAINQVQKGSAALVRMEEILLTENMVKEKPDARPVHSFDKCIEFRDVHFAYGDRKILDGINLKIEKGKTVALVGSSGAGKSTMADLIPRFHDVSSGEILLDGVNIKDYKIDDLRRLMGVVGQDPILFNDSIYNNISLGTGGVSAQQVEEAARIAHANNFILQKPEGYDTEVGDRGSRLSGGERQRITIARAVLKNPPVLILDEATSSLDTESERIVQIAINELMQNRTCIVIAHRLSTVRHADEIVVMSKGQIVQRGRHDELMNMEGMYRKLVEMQEVR